MEQKVNSEINRLNQNLVIFLDALDTQLNLKLLTEERYLKLKEEIQRLYNSEIDYLTRNPKDYFGIYEIETNT